MTIKTQGVSPLQKVAGLVTEYLHPEQAKQNAIQALVERVFEESQKPWSIIFLQINRVLSDQMTMLQFSEKVDEKLGQMFKKTVIERAGGRELCGYTQLQHLCASTYFFYQPAVERFQGLIDEVGKAARVAVVISCGWAASRTVEELRDQIFAPHKFSSNILDKTPGDADQIECWLKQNRARLNIGTFVILSPNDPRLEAKFPRNFLAIGPRVFLPSHRDKALEILTGQKRDVSPSTGHSLQPSEKQKDAESKRQAKRE